MRISQKTYWAAAAGAAIATAIAAWSQIASNPASVDTVARVVNTYPHDPDAFTQGLVIDNGTLFESTGLFGSSSLRRVSLATGAVEQIARLRRELFGEGIAVLEDKIYQVTWQSRTGIVFNRESFAAEAVFSYEGEGWGLTTDGTALILSDGSANIRFLDPVTFEVMRQISVTDDRGPVTQLNELEYIEGEIWANVWHEDFIVRIDPADGRVLSTIDLSEVYPRRLRGPEEVCNGIAYDTETGQIYVTGKNWPALFEIELVPLAGG